jgi:hypothetical protein
MTEYSDFKLPMGLLEAIGIVGGLNSIRSLGMALQGRSKYGGVPHKLKTALAVVNMLKNML